MKVRWKRPVVLLVTTAACLVVAELCYRTYLRKSFAARTNEASSREGIWVRTPHGRGCVYSVRGGHEHRSPRWSFRTNDRGFRGRELTRTAPGTRRVLALGDSFTFGWGVGEGKAWPHLLEGMLSSSGQKAVVFNAGVPGYNTVQEACLLEELLGEADPDLVLLGYVVNDAEPQHTVAAPPDLEHRFVKVWLLEKARELVNSLGSGDEPIFQLNYYRHSLDYRRGFAAHSPKWRESRAALARMARLCRARKAPLVVVILPDFDEHFDESYGAALIHARVKQWGAELGLPVYDLLDHLGGKDHKQYRLEEGHPNERGHAVIARYVAQVIRREAKTGK